MMGQVKAARRQILSGWKEIADYLGKGARTVQRYEREMGLPIHRPAGTSSPVAIKAQLDDWVIKSPNRADLIPKPRALNTRTNSLRANFLQIDCEIALTFASIALTTDDQQKRRRTSKTARKAYDTIMRFRQDTDLTAAQKNKLDANLQRLKSELQRLGQSF
jgi:hypothetical protein